MFVFKFYDYIAYRAYGVALRNWKGNTFMASFAALLLMSVLFVFHFIVIAELVELVTDFDILGGNGQVPKDAWILAFLPLVMVLNHFWGSESRHAQLMQRFDALNETRRQRVVRANFIALYFLVWFGILIACAIAVSHQHFYRVS